MSAAGRSDATATKKPGVVIKEQEEQSYPSNLTFVRYSIRAGTLDACAGLLAELKAKGIAALAVQVNARSKGPNIRLLIDEAQRIQFTTFAAKKPKAFKLMSSCYNYQQGSGSDTATITVISSPIRLPWKPTTDAKNAPCGGAGIGAGAGATPSKLALENPFFTSILELDNGIDYIFYDATSLDNLVLSMLLTEIPHRYYRVQGHELTDNKNRQLLCVPRDSSFIKNARQQGVHPISRAIRGETISSKLHTLSRPETVTVPAVIHRTETSRTALPRTMPAAIISAARTRATDTTAHRVFGRRRSQPTPPSPDSAPDGAAAASSLPHPS
jgi:hypothetical protein